MHLRTKVSLYVGGTLLVLFFAVYNILSLILVADFRELEKHSVEENVGRVSDALENKIDDLTVKVSDWGQWDDTYAFVQDGNEEYLDANLQDVALELLHIQFVAITDEDGTILFRKEVNEDGIEVPFSPAFEEYIKTHRALTTHADGQSVHPGIITLPEGVIVSVARAVTSSDGLSPVEGTIIFAFFINDEIAEKLSELTHLKVSIAPYAALSAYPEFTEASKSLNTEHPLFIEPRSDMDTTISGYALKTDVTGEPALALRVELERSLYQRGQESITLFGRIMVGISIFVVIVVLFLFEYLVLRRLFRLRTVVEAVSQNNEEKAHIALPGNDEFSSLAERINAMLAALREMEVKKRESEKRFRTVADSAPVMIWMSDVNGKCTYVNRVWLDFTGRALEQELGLGWEDDVHPDDRKPTTETYKAAFAKQAPFNVEYRLRRADASYGWVFARAIPHFSVDRTFLGYIGSCVDISERKQAEEQRQGYIEEIESMNRIMVERELKMIELKEKIKTLEHHGE